MKKFKKFAALILAGAAMLTLTACSSGMLFMNQIVARKTILNEINAYCDTELTEVKELSDVERAYLEIFAKAGSASVDMETADTDKYDAKLAEVEKNWEFQAADGALLWGGKTSLTMPVSSVQELKQQIAKCGVFANLHGDSIGIATVTIDGVTYWSFSIYSAK